MFPHFFRPNGMRFLRRTAALVPFALLAVLASLSARSHAFSLDDVTARARALADAPYVAPVNNLPPVFGAMQFADYQKLRPRIDRFEWRDQPTPFKLNFYHQGMQFNTPVKINEIAGERVAEIPYDAARFDFGDLTFDKESTSQLGYAGFRVLYPVNRDGKDDEVLSFLGASYFRVIGKGQVYGLSSRGLALDSLPPGPEEFPTFREFWIQRPAPRDRQLVIYALLDSPRATGAYQFILTPGADTVIDVQSNVFMRGDVQSIGIAPLTSMFLYGPNQQSVRRNFRPAIHDSNGLAIHSAAGEWIWRPLNNPRDVAISTFSLDGVRGFGLLQRGREFHRFEDLRDRYDLRPSAWIEPQNDWGKGKVTLMELPTADETNDNIVAFWTPDAPVARGQMLQFAYRMHWTTNEAGLHAADNGWVRQTFQSAGDRLQPNLIRAPDGTTVWLVDFEGPALSALPPGTALQAEVSTNANAELLETSLEQNATIGGWRLLIRARVRDPDAAVELRAVIVDGGRPLTETWSYQLPPGARVQTIQ